MSISSSILGSVRLVASIEFCTDTRQRDRRHPVVNVISNVGTR